MCSSYNMVGFQNHMKFSDQRSVFRLIPGLEHAEFLRLGQIHRNTYINGPRVLCPGMSARSDPRVFFAGQLAGTEGYIENVASGLVAGVNAIRLSRGEGLVVFLPETAIGALCRYVSAAQGHFAPMNINFGLMPPLDISRRISRADRQRLMCERALDSLRQCQPA